MTTSNATSAIVVIGMLPRHRRIAPDHTFKSCDMVPLQIHITTGLNLRDVGGTAPDTIRPGQVFRSSQVFRCVVL